MPRLTNLVTVEVWSFIKRFSMASTNFEGSRLKIAEFGKNRIENKSRTTNICHQYFHGSFPEKISRTFVKRLILLKKIALNIPKTLYRCKINGKFAKNALNLSDRLQKFWAPVRGPVRCITKD